MKKIKSVLLIDDDEPTNFIHKYVLEKSGLVEKIEVANNGIEALELLTKLKTSGQAFPDLIFLDINMPAMNGWEFLEAYQSSDIYEESSIIIVMLTTSLNPDDQEKANSYEAIKEYLNKPLSADTIADILAKYHDQL